MMKKEDKYKNILKSLMIILKFAPWIDIEA